MSDKLIYKLLRLILYAALGVLGIFILFKYILPWTSPFILAFITAMLLEPIIRYAEKHIPIKRWLISTAVTIIFLALIIFSGHLLITKAASALSDFISDLPNALSGITDSLGWMQDKIYSYIDNAPSDIREYLESALDSILLSIQQLPGELSGTVFNFITNLISYMPKILLFIGTYAVGVFFISSRYGEVRSFLLRQIPKSHQHKLSKLKTGIFGTLAKWLKAQMMLIGVTFLELTAGFILLRIEHPLLIALAVAFIDALPVLGVGTVLLPWAVLKLITGNTTMAIGLIVLYAAVTLIHSLLEPKLVGSQLGLHPVATLLAMYIGFSSIGIIGMILFPMGLIILKTLNDDNIIKLWR